MRTQKSWNIKASCFAKNTFNPIRSILENLQIAPHPDKPMIALSIGDPTVFGNLKPANEIIEAVKDSLYSGKFNGYAPSTGYLEAREAVAAYCSTPTSTIEPKDIILCSGCSCALDISITALCSPGQPGQPGQNILVPRPGFPLYQTLAEGLGISIKYYDLLPERSWEVDLKMMEAQIDAQTAAIVVNNPSNPCGSVFGRGHLLDILAVAERNKLPIIADEIYDNFVFKGQEFHWIASLTAEVPVLSCGGLTKRFLVPGWRVGWIAVHDRHDILAKEVRHGLQNLSQRILGSNSLVQGAIPAILSRTPQSFFDETLQIVEDNAKLSFQLLNKVPGLHPVMPQGAMYMMVGIQMEHFPEFENDLKIVEMMVAEESVFCLPGKCFNFPNYFRIVLTVPQEQMKEACERIAMFCVRHTTKSLYNNDLQLSSSTNSTHNGSNSVMSFEETTNDSGVDTEMDINESDLTTSGFPLKDSSAILIRNIIAVEVDGEK